jgi:hypothetical protein
VTDQAELQTPPSAPDETEPEPPASLPPRLGTETADSFTIVKKGAGPDGTEKRAS